MIYGKAEKSLENLLNWIQSNGDAGFDPYDIKGLNDAMLRRMQPVAKLGFSDKFYRYFVIELLDAYIPGHLRKWYRVEPKIHATAQGLLFDTYLNMSALKEDPGTSQKITHYRDWLIENRSKKYPEIGWGTPFKWRSGDVIYDIGEPFAVVNAWVGNAFYKSYKQKNNTEDLEICKSICEFFVNRLHISRLADDKICFSYSAVQPTFINNANLFVAEFLIRIGLETNNQHYIDLGTQATHYSLSTQMNNGVLPYFGPEAKKALKYDSYHSGYEIRMLYAISMHLKDEKIKGAAQKYFSFYLTHFLKGNRCLTKANKHYPVDITAAAECLLLLSQTREFQSDDQLHRNILIWTINMLQSKQGWFIYRIQKPGIKIKIPYIRWGEAWMALALSESLIRFKNDN